MVREAGLRWMLFVAGWSTGLAYTTAVVGYQVGSFGQHPPSSSLWITGSITFVGGCLLAKRRYGQQHDAKRIPIVQLSRAAHDQPDTVRLNLPKLPAGSCFYMAFFCRC